MNENPAIAEATRAVAAAVPLAEVDPLRPVFHFRPPAQWMNDPNGTIFHNGWYHVFYQHNPFLADWGPMFWGHTRSRDLVHWELLPIALWPSTELDESGCWSGSAVINRLDQPLLIYTSVSQGQTPEGTNYSRKPFEQWGAVSDDEMLVWHKHRENPLLDLARHGHGFLEEWRDPFIFQERGRTFLIVGKCGVGTPLYEAMDDSFSQWEYRGLMCDLAPECPNFAHIGDEWIYLSSPHSPVEYHVGDFDLETLKFTPRTHGVLDPGNFYASNLLHAPDGRCLLFGWITGFPAGKGWNGCLSLPRELTIGADGHPRQQPVAELKQLRSRQLPAGEMAANCLEIRAEFAPGQDDCGLRLKWPDSGSEFVIEAQNNATEPRVVHAFFDRSVLEVFFNDGQASLSKVLPAGVEPAQIEMIGTQPLAVEIWEMQSIW
jgi:beta-fructofuranosidase